MGLPLPTFATFLVTLLIIPFSFLAAVTTWFATTVLLSRLILVYLKIGIALVNSYFLETPNHGASLDVSSERLARQEAYDDLQDRAEIPQFQLAQSWQSGIRKRTSLDLLNSELPPPTVPGARDYEGIGGWRVDEGQNDEQGDLWLRSNSRLELPGDVEVPRRRHFRSSTSSGIVPRVILATDQRSP